MCHLIQFGEVSVVQRPVCSGEGDGKIEVNISEELLQPDLFLLKLR